MNELIQKLLANPASLLVGGGVITAVVAGWKQVKGFLDQLISILIVRAHIHGPASYYFGEQLARDWYMVPSQKINFWSERRPTRDYKDAIVMWRVFGGSGIFIKGWRFMVVTTLGGNEAVLWTIRGVLDLQKLAIDAASRGTARLASLKAIQSSFYKRVMIGDPKFGPGKFEFGGNPDVKRVRSDGAAANESSAPIESEPGYITMWQQAKPPISMTRDQLDIPQSKGLNGFYYDPPVMSEIADIERWLQMQSWFQERHLPWTRGWLLWGPPGTGKSSLAEVTAKHLGIPLYIFKLATVSDQELTDMWSELHTPCLCLFEDFDAVFDGRKPLTEHKSLTFDCILNLLSGPQQRDGVFLVVTTNHVEKIDPALGLPKPDSESGESTRPGRVDRIIHLGSASLAQRQYVVDKILQDFDTDTRRRMVADMPSEFTVAQVQDRCIQFIMDALRGGAYPQGKNPLKEHGAVAV